MKMFKSGQAIIGALFMGLLLSGCGNSANVDTKPVENTSEVDVESEATDEVAGLNGEITIVYTNDVHSYIANVVKDDDGNVAGDGLRLSKIKAYVDDERAEGKNVILVDAGDEVQGNIYGGLDQGETIIKLMNAAGYELATPGNHEFDYGMFQFFNLVDKADYPYISCNFKSLEKNESVFEASKIFEIAGKKVAFVGITTPETLTSSTPVYFQNEQGEYIYAIDGTEGGAALYESVQNAIDSVKDEADYVIALGHLGIGMEAKNKGISSEDLIANTTGIDAFIDGHSHSTVEASLVANKEGKDVLLTQTGYYLNSFGVMTISEDGSFETKLINDYDREDEAVAELELNWINEVDNQLGEKIASLETPLYICNPENDTERWIRAMEMNSGDIIADSIYWYFNENQKMNCDIAIVNGGGIRSAIESGDITYKSLQSVQPFGNVICLINATGEQIINALEMGATESGLWNDEWNTPAENGGFLQVAGLRYTIDSTIPSSVDKSDDGSFVSCSGDNRVINVEVYNKDKKAYEPIDSDKEYTVGGINYLLRNGGSGLSMFMKNDAVVDYVGIDYIICADYLKSFTKEGDYPVIKSANSPLAAYDNYLLDYENPLGSGRIEIVPDPIQK